MKDFNFFEPYIDKKETSGYGKLILYTVAPVVILGMIVYPLINVFRINFLKKNITTIKTNLESGAIYERLDAIERKKEKVSEMEKKFALLEDADRIIESRDIVNDLLLNKITGKVPKDIFFRSLNLSSGQIQIQGTATNNLAIAQLENNLRSDKDFKDIYIPNISLNEDLYDFSINFALKDAGGDNTGQDDVVENGLEQKDVGQNEIK